MANTTKKQMTQIYTGYAGDLGLLNYYQSCGLQPVIISGGRISGYPHCKDSKYCKKLAPTLKWWWPWHQSLSEHNMRVAEKWYTKYYTNNILKTMNPYKTYTELTMLGNGHPVILCCAGEREEYLFCHRHILGQWLSNNIPNLHVSEFTHPSQHLLLQSKER